MRNASDTLSPSSPPPKGSDVALVIRSDLVDAVALTGRQLDIIEYIRDHVSAHGYPPSVREIGDAVGLKSTSSVHYQLCQLEDLGVLVRGEQRARAIRLAEAA